jgi:para-nitrobenzyl esterase
MKTLIAMLILFAANPASAAGSGPIVTVTGGKVQGVLLEKGGAVFKGIPYAQPPVGDLRWREPMPVKPWSGVRDATKLGAACMQGSFMLGPGGIQSEDCLFINVETPGWPTTLRLPVMVWIHGGGNFAGSGHSPMTNGENLIRRGVVVVSFNYRLGPFGFFAHPALTRESSNKASGNQGILDQIAALKWVRDNIAKFGGDPGNITIFGESAGSLDVSVLMTTPLSKGLFHRAIGESGPAVLVGEPRSLDEAEKHGQGAALRWKVPVDASVKDLRAVSADDILAGEPKPEAMAATVFASFPNLGIIVDGYVFPRKPAEVYAAGQQHRVPLMLGSNAREQIPAVPPPTDLAKAITENYGPLAERAKELYVGNADPQYGTPAEQWGTDTSFRCASVAQLAWHAAAGNPAFEFEFARVPKGSEAVGATHGSEIVYVFNTLGKQIAGLGPPVEYTEVDSRISDEMQRYWTNFAKTGDPNGKGLPVWPKFDASSRSYIQFTDSGPVAKQGLRRAYCDLFIENVNRLLKR